VDILKFYCRCDRVTRQEHMQTGKRSGLLLVYGMSYIV